MYFISKNNEDKEQKGRTFYCRQKNNRYLRTEKKHLI